MVPEPTLVRILRKVWCCKLFPMQIMTFWFDLRNVLWISFCFIYIQCLSKVWLYTWCFLFFKRMITVPPKWVTNSTTPARLEQHLLILMVCFCSFVLGYNAFFSTSHSKFGGFHFCFPGVFIVELLFWYQNSQKIKNNCTIISEIIQNHDKSIRFGAVSW